LFLLCFFFFLFVLFLGCFELFFVVEMQRSKLDLSKSCIPQRIRWASVVRQSLLVGRYSMLCSTVFSRCSTTQHMTNCGPDSALAIFVFLIGLE